MEAIPYDQICRLCVLNCNSINLFTTANSETPSYSELVTMLSNEINIIETDEFPNSICDECAFKLVEYYKFKLLIEKSNNDLKYLLKVDDIGSTEYEIDNFTNLPEIDNNIIEDVNTIHNIVEDNKITKYLISSPLKEDGYSSPENFIYDHDDSGDQNIELLEDDVYHENIYDNEFLKEKIFTIDENNDLIIKNEYDITECSNDNIDGDSSVKYKYETNTDKLSPKEQNEWHKKLGAWIKKQSVIAKKSKRYKCDVCGKDYGSKFAMNNHTYVHTGELNFECTECGRKFGQKKLLQAHMEVKHIKSKFFYCDTCGKCFNRKNNLLKHQWVHLDTGRFSCDYCGRIFKWKTSLNVHLTSHTGLKEYNCYMCGKNYTSDASRRKHCKQVHDGKGIKPLMIEIQCEDLITEQTILEPTDL